MPKALRSVSGLLLLLATVGLTTCQALFHAGTPYGVSSSESSRASGH